MAGSELDQALEAPEIVELAVAEILNDCGAARNEEIANARKTPQLLFG